MNRQLLSPEKTGGDFAEPTYNLAGGHVKNYKKRQYEYIYDLPEDERPQAAVLAAMEIARIISPKYRLQERLQEADESRIDQLEHDVLQRQIAEIDLKYAAEALKIIESHQNGLAHLENIAEPFINLPKSDPHDPEKPTQPIPIIQAIRDMYDNDLFGTKIRRQAINLIRILLARQHGAFDVQ